MSLETQFAQMGARVKINAANSRGRFIRPSGPVSLDVRRDDHGEYFDIRVSEGVDVQVVDVQRKDRHLLLLARTDDGKDKFLCGHDERAWFVAAVPNANGVSNVKTAKEALKPAAVRNEQARKGLKSKHLGKRHNEAYIRQGEWFFIPRPNFTPRKEAVVLKNEPIQRGNGSKPHFVEFLHRTGGEQVWVSNEYPNGLNATQFAALPKEKRQKGNFRVMVADAAVYAKGRVRHSDHATVILDCWHEVVMNTENQSRAMRHVRFLD
jgi:hypothetical protein